MVLAACRLSSLYLDLTSCIAAMLAIMVVFLGSYTEETCSSGHASRIVFASIVSASCPHRNTVAGPSSLLVRLTSSHVIFDPSTSVLFLPRGALAGSFRFLLPGGFHPRATADSLFTAAAVVRLPAKSPSPAGK
eukprot:GHVU01040979.1.p1 GENE.GHVU01040979.1~~GHVU01040979.1.p1  ORF type:complete len:134 (+),score=0.84 GHVU01040979.1:684-1085(+)